MKLHSRIKKISTSLGNLERIMMNWDILRSAINVFPKMTQWVSIIHSFYISKNFEACILDEFFVIMKFHESHVELCDDYWGY